MKYVAFLQFFPVNQCIEKRHEGHYRMVETHLEIAVGVSVLEGWEGVPPRRSTARASFYVSAARHKGGVCDCGGFSTIDSKRSSEKWRMS